MMMHGLANFKFKVQQYIPQSDEVVSYSVLRGAFALRKMLANNIMQIRTHKIR